MFRVSIAKNHKEREDAFFVRKKVFVEEQGVPLSLELDKLDDTASHFVVYKGENPIGAGRFRELKPLTGKVERICILSEFRGKSLGALIMSKLESHAKVNGFEEIILNAQTYAIPFYEKLGYEVTSPEFMDADIPHRAMKKKIKQ